VLPTRVATMCNFLTFCWPCISV